MEGEVWRLTRKTAQIDLSKESHSNVQCSHFKVNCLVSIGSSALQIYSTFPLLLRQLITSQNTPGRQVFLSHSTSEEAIPQNIKQLSKVTEQTRSRASNHNSWIPLTLHLYCNVLSPNVCSIMTLQRRQRLFFLIGKKTVLFWMKSSFCVSTGS